MTQEQYQAIMTEYRLQREKNAEEEARRKEEVRARDPELGWLMTERHQMVLDFCRRAANGQEKGSPVDMMADYNARIRERLLRDGFPADYLEPVYRCAKCRDTGLMGDTVRRECDCFKARAAQLEDRVSTWRESFEAFDEDLFPDTPLEGQSITQRQLMKRVRQVCEDYADAFPSQSPPDLLLSGSSGLGKSYLLSCIARRLRERGHTAELVSSYDAVRDAYFGREDGTDPLFSSELMLLDDLGMEPMMENITLEQLFNLINSRRSRGLPMVISTNLTMNEIKKRYSERISSRLLDVACCRLVMLSGQDVRLLRR